MTTFKPGQMVIRKREEQTEWQRGNWESKARVHGFAPYGPVEVAATDPTSGNLALKQVSGIVWWRPHLFTPALIDKELEDYL